VSREICLEVVRLAYEMAVSISKFFCGKKKKKLAEKQGKTKVGSLLMTIS
jgi:hypothetical protein